MPKLYRVLYCSRNCLSGDPASYPAEIETILAKSRLNNGRDDVTGGLLFSDGCFAQVLEGRLTDVERAFERIQCDARHQEVTVLQTGEIAHRDFPDWSMAFTGVDARHTGAHGTLADAFSGTGTSSSDVLRMMRQVIVHEEDWLMPA